MYRAFKGVPGLLLGMCVLFCVGCKYAYSYIKRLLVRVYSSGPPRTAKVSDARESQTSLGQVGDRCTASGGSLSETAAGASMALVVASFFSKVEVEKGFM